MEYFNQEQKRKIQAMLEKQRENEVEQPQDTDYTHRLGYTPCAFKPQKESDDFIKITVLTQENQKLKNQYFDLVQKSNKLVAAYRELQTENEILKKKKEKQESWANAFASIRKSVQNIYQKFNEWLKT